MDEIDRRLHAGTLPPAALERLGELIEALDRVSHELDRVHLADVAVDN